MLSSPHKPLLNANLLWMLAALIPANIASEMVFTLLPVYLRSLGADVGQVGLTYTLASLVPLVLQIFGGWLSDTIGRLRTVAIGSLCALLGYGLFLIAPNWQWVIAALCLEFVSGSLVGPSFGAYLADQSSEEDRGKVFGLFTGIFMVVNIIGPALAGIIADRAGFKVLYTASLVLYAAATALRLWMALARRFAPPQGSTRPTLASFRLAIREVAALLAGGGVLTWILVTDGVRDISVTFSDDLKPLYMTQIGGLSLEQVGLVASLGGVAMMLVTLAAGWLSDHFGERRLIAAGFLLEAVGGAVFLMAPGFTGFAAAGMIFSAGIGLMGPAFESLTSKVVPEERRGLAFGLMWSGLGLFSLPAPWIGSQLWQKMTPQAPFWLTVALVLLAILPVWFRLKLPTKDTGNRPSGESRPGSQVDL